MDKEDHGNKISDTFCEHLCVEGGDLYSGNIHGVAVYSIGMHKTTLVVASIFFCVVCSMYPMLPNSLDFTFLNAPSLGFFLMFI